MRQSRAGSPSPEIPTHLGGARRVWAPPGNALLAHEVAASAHIIAPARIPVRAWRRYSRESMHPIQANASGRSPKRLQRLHCTEDAGALGPRACVWAERMPLGEARNGCGDCIVQERILLNGHDLQRWTRWDDRVRSLNYSISCRRPSCRRSINTRNALALLQLVYTERHQEIERHEGETTARR